MKPLLTAARAALQWRLLLLWLAGLLLPAALLSLPVGLTLSAQLDHSVQAPALARALDLVALADLGTDFQRNEKTLTAIGAAAVVLTLLLSPLLTGAAVVAARAPRRLPIRELLAGGAAQYPRMLRMLAWAAVLLGATGLLAGRLGDAANEHMDKAIAWGDAQPWQVAATVAAALLLLLAHLTLDTGRAALAIDLRRTSAVKAWWRGLALLRRRPGGVLLAWAVPTVAGLLLAALLAWGRLHVPAIGIPGTLGAVLLAQLIVLVLAWMRMARLFALVALAREQAGPAQLH